MPYHIVAQFEWQTEVSISHRVHQREDKTNDNLVAEEEKKIDIDRTRILKARNCQSRSASNTYEV